MSKLAGHVRRHGLAYVALSFALSVGGAVAAGQLPKHSVGTPQLKGGAVVSSKIANGQVRPPDLSKAYLAGKGRAFSGRINVPDTTGAGTKVASIPGLGRIDVNICNSGAVEFDAAYHNTSAKTEDLWFYEADDNGVTANQQSLQPGERVTLGGAYHNWEHSLLSVGAGFGAGARVANATVSVATHGPPVTCAFQVEGAVQR